MENGHGDGGDGMQEDGDLRWLSSCITPAEEGWTDPTEGGVLTLVLKAAEDGGAEELTSLLGRLQVSVNSTGEDGDTPLHLASLYGHEACVQVLLNAGADANMKDSDDSTPLHDASAGGYIAIVRALYQKAPGELNAQDAEGDTPLHNAARGGHLAVAQFLLDQGADGTIKNALGEQAADLAGSDAAPELRACLRHAAASGRT